MALQILETLSKTHEDSNQKRFFNSIPKTSEKNDKQISHCQDDGSSGLEASDFYGPNGCKTG